MPIATTQATGTDLRGPVVWKAVAMTDEEPQPPHNPYAGTEHQPNWGSAYPPPGQQPGQQPPGYYPPPGGYYPPPGYAYPQYVAPPKHQSATTSLVLGLVGLVGGFACYLPAFVAPFAWYTGAKTLREIDASQGQLGGRSEAKAGMIMGIIGTVLLAIALVLLVLFIVLIATAPGDFWDDDYTEYDTTFLRGAFASLLP